MRASQFHLVTLRESPAGAEIISHQLMLRAGLIKPLAAGIYSWLPLGLRVLRKVEQIVREEMDAAGSLELLMPSVQPADLWQESQRWDQFGPELLRFEDRGARPCCLAPTHEEVITDIARKDLQTLGQLPIIFYQIQTKFRDEIRPRFGVMRAREFMMKDAYSFDSDQSGLSQSFDTMNDAYHKIFNRLGLNFRSVEADSGAIGGNASREFHVLADSGEDKIVFSDSGDYAANIEKAVAICQDVRAAATEDMQLIDTPDVKTIDDLVQQHQIPITRTIKTLVLVASDAIESPLIALVVRGDHTLNLVKAGALAEVAYPPRLADPAQIIEIIGAAAGSLGPVNLPIPCIVDHSVAAMSDFCAGANIDHKHYRAINWGRDLPEPTCADLRNVVEHDPSPCGTGRLKIARGIEVGHIFQLGTKYSEAMAAGTRDQSGHQSPFWMGCYGIGISRIVAASIEQRHDERGIVWPDTIAPFQVAIIPINRQRIAAVQEETMRLYALLTEAGIDVLLDDRDARLGVMLSDMELIGIPHQFVVSERGLKNNTLEYRARACDQSKTDIAIAEALPHIQHCLATSKAR